MNISTNSFLQLLFLPGKHFRVATFICCLISLLVGNRTFAEGSRELNANGGYRAYLYAGTTASASFPFPTSGTIKVYVKAGEILYVGSSAL